MTGDSVDTGVKEISETIFTVLVFITIVSAILVIEDNNLLEANLLSLEIEKSAEYMTQGSTIIIELNENTQVSYNNNELNIQIGKATKTKKLSTKYPITISQEGQTLTLKS